MLKFESCRRYQIQNTKLPKQHHDKKTLIVIVYQNTKIDARRHTTDQHSGEDGSTALERSSTHVTRGLNLV